MATQRMRGWQLWPSPGALRAGARALHMRLPSVAAAGRRSPGSMNALSVWYAIAGPHSRRGPALLTLQNASPHPQPTCAREAGARAHPGRSILGVMMGCGTVSNLRSSAAPAGAAYGLASAPLSVRAEARPPLGEGAGACARHRR